MSFAEDLRRVARHAKSYLGDLESKKSQNNGNDYSYLEAGSGKTVVFLHGFGTSKSSWRPVMHALYHQFHVVALDVPGCNISTVSSTSSFTFRAQADWLDKALATIGLQKVHLVGFSANAALAAYYTSLFPAKIASLTLLNLPDVFVNPALGSEERLRFLNSLRATTVEEVNKIMNYFFYEPTLLPDMVVRRFLKQMVVHEKKIDQYMRDTCNSIPLLIARMGEISVPVLALTGKNDNFAPSSVLETVTAAVPHAQTHIVPKCGHFSFIEKPYILVDKLSEFLGTMR